MFRAKNWGSFQSYKDRNPPWIRLHKRLIDDINFQKMSVEARALLPMIWLLISEDEEPSSGMLRIGYEEITFRLRIHHGSVKVVLDEIVKAGFLERVGAEEEFPTTEKTQAETICYGTVTETLRNCHSETETYSTETETETETKIIGAKKKKPKYPEFVCPEWLILKNWDDYLDMRKGIRKPATQRAQELILAKLRKFWESGLDPNLILEQSILNNWQDVYEPKQEKGKINGKSKLQAEADKLLDEIRAGKYL